MWQVWGVELIVLALFASGVLLLVVWSIVNLVGSWRGEQADLQIIVRRRYARGEFSREAYEQASDLLTLRS